MDSRSGGHGRLNRLRDDGEGDLSYVRASDVINNLKDELAFVDSHPINKRIAVLNESCGDRDQRSVLVTGKLLSADVSLKTIATDTVTGTAAGSKLPLGAVLIGVSGSLTRSTIRTQQVTYTVTNASNNVVSLARIEEVQNMPFAPADDGSRDPRGGPESRLWAAVVERGQEPERLDQTEKFRCA
jgi:hypothetical protein